MKDEGDPRELRYWSQTIDGTLYACWYRLRDEGQIEIFARGHRVTVPLEAVALLPESIARAVLAQLRETDGGGTLSDANRRTAPPTTSDGNSGSERDQDAEPLFSVKTATPSDPA